MARRPPLCFSSTTSDSHRLLLFVDIANGQSPAAVFATTKYSFGNHPVKNPQHYGRPHEGGAAIVRGFEAAYRERRNLAHTLRIR
jgi:hypothetical protein